MALTVVTILPNAQVQLGAASNTVVGAANAAAAWSDSLDTSYVQLTARCSNDGDIVRVSFPTPSIPAGAKVLSVEFEHKVMTVAELSPQPVGLHWYRALEGLLLIYGQLLTPKKIPVTSLCPAVGVGGTYEWKSLGAKTISPAGVAWDATTNLLSGNFTYDYGRGDDIGGSHRVSEVRALVTFQAQSTVAVTAPTGTVASTRPTVKWTFTSPDSMPQQGYQVMVYTAAQVAAVGFTPFVSTPLQDSGELLGEDLQWQLIDDLPDGTYSAYVRSLAKWAGPNDFPTAIASITWTRTVAAGGGGQPAAAQPPNAILSSTTFELPDDRVAITMVPSSASPVTAAYTVLVSRDNGVTYDSPPSLKFIQANGMTPVVKYDYLAPIAATSKYQVLSYSQSGGLYVAAAGLSSVSSALTSGDTWRLADPSNPLNNCIVVPVAGGKDGKANKVTFPRLAAMFQTIGGTGEKPPIVVSGPTYGEAGMLTLLFIEEQLDNWPSFKEQMQSGHTLMLKKSFSEQLWVQLAIGPNTQDPELTYDVVPGKASVVYWRKITLPYTQVRPPAFY